MATTKKPKPNEIPSALDANQVNVVLASLEDEALRVDCLVILDRMRGISGHEPKLWNVATFGFDTYHYKYESGREGDCHVLGFHPRKGKITFYLMDGTARHSELLTQLGKHTTSKACLYIKRLSDIQLPILERILHQSYDHIKSRDGQMHRAFE